MGMWDALKPKTVIGVERKKGQIGKKKRTLYTIVLDAKEKGLVIIDKKKYYFLGATEKTYDDASLSKGLGGAAIGTILAPGLGTLIGGAIGARKQRKIELTMVFMDVESKEKYFLEGKVKYTKPEDLEKLEAHPIAQEIGLSEDNEENAQESSSAADEIRKFKTLFDDGIITEEEFNKKKQELLS